MIDGAALLTEGVWCGGRERVPESGALPVLAARRVDRAATLRATTGATRATGVSAASALATLAALRTAGALATLSAATLLRAGSGTLTALATATLAALT